MASGVLVVSCSSTQPEEIIKNLLETKNLPEPESHFQHIKSYPWHLETKYYKTDLFCFAASSKDISPDFSDSVEAVIIHFDTSQESSFDDVLSWFPIVENFEADVQILVCDSCNYDKLYNKYIPWCVKNKFELVELHPEKHDDDDTDEFLNKTGYRRILEALQAHVWPNLEMKEESNERFSSHNKNDKKLTSIEYFDTLMKDDESFLESLSNEDPSSFESLFQKFNEMKEKASSLTGDERKRYAEKVAIAFWKAFGKDDEEIEGLSSDDDI
ncbi:alpha- and gamma-adaptin-binding protein p34-like [Centruroides vittatus]|uniref:alpha- and gamma-adaptin-binding protein p34-like n=1 Tax=Centruroides vittatus TaxID=120091 RepID=UPI00350F1BE7